MYNSSIKGQSTLAKFDFLIEIDGSVFVNDMSKQYMNEAFKKADVIFSEIAWNYGYKIFNERAENNASTYHDYMNNISKCIHELDIPAFIVCGKPAKKYFKDAKSFPIAITTSDTNMSGCQLYVWNYSYDRMYENTTQLIKQLSKEFKCCLDFSCGYGEHLLSFSDFVACDINKDCITYLSTLKERKEHGKTKN